MNTGMPIRSVLVATELCEGCDETVRTGAEMAARAGAELHVLHALEEASAVSGESRELLMVQRQVHERRAMLHDQVERALPAGVAASVVRVGLGPPSAAILAAAKEVKADVIVLGPHRHRGVADRYLGSTAERVLRHATVPCLVLNGPLRLPVRSVLVPTDLSEPARRALGAALLWTAALGEQGQVRIALTHVVDAGVGVQKAPSTPLEIHQELERLSAEERRRLDVDVPVEVNLLQGRDPAERLVRFAEEIEAELVVMGTHGDRVLVRALLGSVSSALARRAGVPVLLVPGRAGIAGAAAEEREAADAAPIPA